MAVWYIAPMRSKAFFGRRLVLNMRTVALITSQTLQLQDWWRRLCCLLIDKKKNSPWRQCFTMFCLQLHLTWLAGQQLLNPSFVENCCFLSGSRCSLRIVLRSNHDYTHKYLCAFDCARSVHWFLCGDFRRLRSVEFFCHLNNVSFRGQNESFYFFGQQF